MKTKNRYKRSRVILFIGLLSFHALSSCVNTSGQLGMDKKSGKESVTKGQISSPHSKMSRSKEEEAFIHIIDKYRLYKPVPWYKKPKYVWGLAGGGAVTLLVLATTMGSWYLSPSSFTNQTGNNPSVSNNRTSTEMSSNSTAFEDINQTQTELPVNNVTSQNPPYLRGDDVPYTRILLKNNAAMQEVQNANFSEDSIERFLDTENIDAVDKENCTLLIHAVSLADLKTLRSEYKYKKPTWTYSPGACCMFT